MGVTDQGAREARYAEAIGCALDDGEPSWGINDRAHESLTRAAVAAVLPLVDAEVAAAVSEAQAERDEARRLLDTMDHFAEVAETCERKSKEWAAEVERLHEGADDTPHDPAAWMTPAQTWSHLLALESPRRLNRLEALIIGCQEGEIAQREVERLQETVRIASLQGAREVERRVAAEAEVERLREGIRSLHTKGYASTSEEVWGQNPQCDECGVAWPCDTIALLSTSPAATTGEECPDCGHIHTPEGCTGPSSPSDQWAGVSVEGCDCDFDQAPPPLTCPVTGGPLHQSFDHGALVCTSCGSLAHTHPTPVSSGEGAVCAKDVGDPPEVCRCLLPRGHAGLHECKHKRPAPVLGWASSETGGAVSAKPGWWLPAPVSSVSSGEAATGEADGAWLHETDGTPCPEQFPLGHRFATREFTTMGGLWWCTTHQSEIRWTTAPVATLSAEGSD